MAGEYERAIWGIQGVGAVYFRGEGGGDAGVVEGDRKEKQREPRQHRTDLAIVCVTRRGIGAEGEGGFSGGHGYFETGWGC